MDSNDKLYGILAYIGILVLIPLLAGKTEFTRYHANQGLVYLIVDVIAGAALGVVCTVLAFIPIIGWILAAIIPGIVSLGLLVLMIMGIVNAAQGQMKPLPLIGHFQILK